MTTTIGSPQMLANEERLSNEMHALKNRSEQNGQSNRVPLRTLNCMALLQPSRKLRPPKKNL
ncbi:CBM_collapsed_G0038350.mRNA.1.CDS.1 [Saccharomyces cerevisiae]|nr:CBM_collapsed_G0038350.mRNA.1.CDS.1 [Saccharomyces cerevisiae]